MEIDTARRSSASAAFCSGSACAGRTRPTPCCCSCSRARAADDQREAALQACSGSRTTSRSSIGTSGAPVCPHHHCARARTSSAISVPRMVDDTVSMLELLRRRFGRKPFVAGFSFGATFAAYAAARRPTRGRIGRDRHGHRRARCRGARLRLRPRCRAATRSPARHPPARGDRPAAAHRPGSVPHAGPLGGELRRRHHRRHLPRHRPHAAREPPPLTRLLGHRGAPCPSGRHGLAGRAAA